MNQSIGRPPFRPAAPKKPSQRQSLKKWTVWTPFFKNIFARKSLGFYNVKPSFSSIYMDVLTQVDPAMSKSTRALEGPSLLVFCCVLSNKDACLLILLKKGKMNESNR
jgi:hypothetical protein